MYSESMTCSGVMKRFLSRLLEGLDQGLDDEEPPVHEHEQEDLEGQADEHRRQHQ